MTPAPGIVLGRYPERRALRGPSVWARIAASLPQLTIPSQARRGEGFVARVRQLELEWRRASAASFRERARELRAQLARDGLQQPARMEEAFALIASACTTHLGVRLYDTQLIAARILLDGHLAEMATGEGKTLAVAMAAASAAMAGIPVHVVTANDYLVERDAESLRPVYEALGLTIGTVTQPMNAATRRAAYACDITYCTAKELVFDYLRDRLAGAAQGELAQHAAALSGNPEPLRLLRGLCLAVIDEADSVLIDEARVPLILARRISDPECERLQAGWRIGCALNPEEDFRIEAQTRQVTLTERGRQSVRRLASGAAQLWPNARECEEAASAALVARCQFERGRDYVVEGGAVQIVDPISGRKAPGRAWSHGVHQMVEIKEGCSPSAPTETLAQITYQRFFGRYLSLCGVSGTLRESAGELREIYGLALRQVPLREPDRRTTFPPRFFANADARWSAVVSRVREMQQRNRPVLVGTDSILDSEALSRRLSAAGLPHRVLNATQDREEAGIVAGAGTAGAITVATNMAGRGTDIVLCESSRASGGLHVLCCQQNLARRIDRQLVGRSARQGDPGTAEYLVLLEGPLLGGSWPGEILKRCLPGGAGRSRIGMLWVRLLQRTMERRHRRERRNLLLADWKVSDWLAFGGPE